MTMLVGENIHRVNGAGVRQLPRAAVRGIKTTFRAGSPERARGRQRKTPALQAGVSGRKKRGLGRRSVLRVLPGDVMNVGTRDADVGEVAVAQTAELAQALVVTAPGAEEIEEVREQEHVIGLCCGA